MKKILIANRGEIAVRIAKTCKEMGIEPILIYSDADKDLPYVKEANKAYRVGEPPVAKSYLNRSRILEIALEEKVDAIHPGYGFLSENATFIREIENANIIFIGPEADVVEAMGDKVKARETMMAAGVPVVPGSDGPVEGIEDAVKVAENIGYPVMVKASAGGGGIGMQKCDNEKMLRQAFISNQNRAKAYFGNGDMFIEKYIEEGRHIEVQIFGDQEGNVVHLYERDCSVQRRHQKVIEETPSPYLSPSLREKICQSAVKAAKHVGYKNAGTIEFIVDDNENFYFLEMNTRLQVEHPITELTTGIDLVKWQIHIASGDLIPYKQHELTSYGHSMEFRLYAEDPERFLPSPGKIEEFHIPSNTYIRVDSGFVAGNQITPFYDPMIAKVIITGEDRAETIQRAIKTFQEIKLSGIKSNVSLFQDILENEQFVKGIYTTKFIEQLKKVNQ